METTFALCAVSRVGALPCSEGRSTWFVKGLGFRVSGFLGFLGLGLFGFRVSFGFGV